MLLNQLLARHAKLHPEKAAVVTADRAVNYAKLDRAVGCTATYLLDHGLRPGDRVAMHWPNSIELVTLMLGAFRAGLIAVPIDPRLKEVEIAHVLEHSGARICFSEPALASLVTLVAVVSQSPPLAGTPRQVPEADTDAPTLLLYTSGTTAQPKGVTHTQRTLFEGARVIANEDIGPSDIPLSITPISHILALVGGLLPALFHGTTAVLLKAFRPGDALDAVERYGCTEVAGLPVLIQLMAEEQAVRPRNISSLRAIVAGGDTVPVRFNNRCMLCSRSRIERALD